MFVNVKGKKYQVIKKPHPHILVSSKKKLHGWWQGKRECTSERFLINPYNGCFFDCFFCYSNSFWGYFNLFYKSKIIAVFKDYHKEVSNQLDKINFASCGYLSPVTDPFQPLENKYRLSEKIIYEFVKRNIPIEFITKSIIPDVVINLLKKQKHSFGQISILTLNEKIYKKLIPKGISLSKIISNFYKLKENNIFSVCRIDPIIPYITDDLSEIYNLIKKVKQIGAGHIVASSLDIPFKLKGRIINFITSFSPKLKSKYIKLYTEKISNGLHADSEYRRKLFSNIKKICSDIGISFSLCMEFEKDRNGIINGLNRYFMTSYNCEGIDIPVYKRVKDSNGDSKGWFDEMEECSSTGKGNCLSCRSKACGIESLISINESKNPKIYVNNYK